MQMIKHESEGGQTYRATKTSVVVKKKNETGVL